MDLLNEEIRAPSLVHILSKTSFYKSDETQTFSCDSRALCLLTFVLLSKDLFLVSRSDHLTT